MSDNATITVTLSVEMAGKLVEFARRRNSTADRVVTEALEHFLRREADIIAAIERGRADLHAGRVFTQAEVAQDVERFIDAARM